MTTMTPITRQDAGRRSFDIVIRVCHWTTVLLILVLGASGYLAHAVPSLARGLLPWHRSAGVCLWLITLLRLAWRWTYARLPPFPAAMSRLHRWVVRTSEYALYGLLLAQPLSGLASSIALGHAFSLFGIKVPKLVAPDLPLFETLHELHEKGALVLAVMIAGHASAALVHHYILRDDTLRAMMRSSRPITLK